MLVTAYVVLRCQIPAIGVFFVPDLASYGGDYGNTGKPCSPQQGGMLGAERTSTSADSRGAFASR
jgi:hypothetical protein